MLVDYKFNYQFDYKHYIQTALDYYIQITLGKITKKLQFLQFS